jgi:PKD repeat protein
VNQPQWQNAPKCCKRLLRLFGYFSKNYSYGSDEYYWDFGIDGITTDTSTEEYPTYVFPDTGVYEVMLIVLPGSECSDTEYVEVWIYPGF